MHDHPHHGHNHGPEHLHSHMDPADEAAELQVLARQFIDRIRVVQTAHRDHPAGRLQGLAQNLGGLRRAHQAAVPDLVNLKARLAHEFGYRRNIRAPALGQRTFSVGAVLRVFGRFAVPD